MLAGQEAAQLRALVEDAWPHRHNLEVAREHAERIVCWHYCRPLARGEIEAARELARSAIAGALEEERRRPRLSIGELLELLADAAPTRARRRR